MSTTKAEFVKTFSDSIANAEAGLFLGAGFSQPAGFVNWRGLLKEIAEDLGLNVDIETDLIAIAQYHLNTKRSRARLNQAIIDEFVKTTHATENHEIISRLPIYLYWTTNYDTLIEDSLRDAGRVVDVKTTSENMATSIRGCDAVVYKMHGDVSQPQRAVLTKDDYERYDITRLLFSEKLKGDLISNSFCFIGFSFTDPNIEHVLRRIRILLGENQKGHYCIMRRPPIPARMEGAELADYEYQARLLELRVGDLQRFAIQTVLIDDFCEITELLAAVSKRAHRKNVFISGAVRDFAPMGQERLTQLCNKIGRALIEDGFNVVSGFGHGVGDSAIIGALQALYTTRKGTERDRLILKPFPRSPSTKIPQSTLDTKHREELVSRSGMAIYICGNKDDGTGTIIKSPGVLEEFKIAKEMGRAPIPIGVTGHAAELIWQQVRANQSKYYRNKDFSSQLDILNRVSATDDEIISAILAMAKQLAAD